MLIALARRLLIRGALALLRPARRPQFANLDRLRDLPVPYLIVSNLVDPHDAWLLLEGAGRELVVLGHPPPLPPLKKAMMGLFLRYLPAEDPRSLATATRVIADYLPVAIPGALDLADPKPLLQLALCHPDPVLVVPCFIHHQGPDQARVHIGRPLVPLEDTVDSLEGRLRAVMARLEQEALSKDPQ